MCPDMTHIAGYAMQHELAHSACTSAYTSGLTGNGRQAHRDDDTLDADTVGHCPT